MTSKKNFGLEDFLTEVAGLQVNQMRFFMVIESGV
jgi:hypothetical protein